MSSAYSFLPWLRRGIATQISADPGSAARAGIEVKLRIDGTPRTAGPTLTQEVGHNVQLYGPGDVIGIDPRAIVRTEPRDWVTNFDPNYLAFIEFYEEDYCWRYSPAVPNGTTGRLAPWLALIVLTEEEFEDAGMPPGRPLPFITVDDLAMLPPPDQVGAFAHVHVNREITSGHTGTNDMAAVLPQLAATLGENPDLACSRLMCPRRLDPVVAYHAFLVPAFETGRLAGLGRDPAGAPGALHSSWSPYSGQPEPGNIPVYHRWSFRTAPTGDFEYLVRLLKPRPPDARVGNRDMDTQEPGAGLPPATPTDPGLDRVLRLGGALKVPESSLSPEELDEQNKYENWDEPYPHPFQTALATLINLSQTYTQEQPLTAHQQIAAGPVDLASVADAGPDPLVTPPLYGRWHALTSRLLTNESGSPLPHPRNWVHELNLDPRFRAAAGIGARVVREHQEEYMQAAWAQIGDVLEANKRIRGAQVAREVSHALHSGHLKTLNQVAPAQVLAMTAPVHSRVVTDAAIAVSGVAGDDAAPLDTAELVSVAAQFARSRIAGAPVSSAMRRQTRPGSRLMRRLPPLGGGGGGDLVQDGGPPPSLLDRMNRDQVRAAPRKVAPPGVTTVDKLESELEGPIIGVTNADEGVSGARGPGGMNATGGTVLVPNPVPGLPHSSDFVISLPGEGVTPHAGGADSPEATRFKQALNAAYGVFNGSAIAGQTPERKAVNLTAIGTGTLDGLHPDRTIPRRVLAGIHHPHSNEMDLSPASDRASPAPRLRALLPTPATMVEAMAYPVIDLPMFQPLIDLSNEFFLPNLNLVPRDSITLLEANQRFIESYMVGLNHEMARELLWREYPTDQRGTPFAQFWDVRGVRSKPGELTEERRERLLDIPPIDTWTAESELGDHDNREINGEKDDELVLVIRGELLKKYPTTVVYAHRAEWLPGPGGTPDPSLGRKLMDLDPAATEPSEDIVKLPLYEAKAAPDIYFFGFDLNEDEARGDSGEHPNDDAGWFFVLKERPGDPRFGLDINREGKLQVWNDLAWPDVLTGPPSGAPRYLKLDASTPALALEAPTAPADAPKQEQYAEDKDILWSAQIGAGDLAYILYQAPVLVAVHAREMLRDG
ncbi:hypothetical protein OG905_37590 [Streptomyces sp. NBC_00322]|uniref:hypothetical protein n=1 Tax=Streptomyces sp. NBC_00322 TaxID=2975712 RepID=UPI002E2C3E72|nr:hypothetical protein [Streptomyces sp. NBC_00322]